MKPVETDLFGQPLAPPAGQRRSGYAARPGTGPKRQRCNTCAHAQRMTSATRRAWKCSAVTHAWDDTPATDIKPGAPACKAWARRPYPETSDR